AKIKLAFGLASKYLWLPASSSQAARLPGCQLKAQTQTQLKYERVAVQHSWLQFDCILTRGLFGWANFFIVFACDAGKTISSI
ncbi:hypothetical protein M5D96_005972, partial [Drosophila gunungcola]